MPKRKSTKSDLPCIGCVIEQAVKTAFPDGPPQNEEELFDFAMKLASVTAGVMASIDWTLDLVFMRQFTERLFELRAGEATDNEHVPHEPFAPGVH